MSFRSAGASRRTVVDVEGSVRHRRLRHVVAVIPAVLAAGCLGAFEKITPQQALVEEAFQSCRSQGPSTKLARVERDGRFSVTGRESEAQKVHDCMLRYAEPAKKEPAVTSPPAPPADAATTTVKPAAPAVKGVALVASRLPGTWRGTLMRPPRSGGQAEPSAATVQFMVAGGTLRWALSTESASPPVSADGIAIVVDGELRMTGTVRAPAAVTPARSLAAEPPRPGVPVRYTGTLVGDRLEVTGGTADKQVHVLSVRRVAE
jgi:hypothetical protein